jgi:hypothetical protein
MFKHRCKRLYLGLKIWDLGKQEWKDFCIIARLATRMLKNSYKDAICKTNNFVPRDIRVLKCNLHLLWETSIFSFVNRSPNLPNLGYGSSYYYIYITANGQTMCTKSKSRVSRLLLDALASTFTFCISMKSKVAKI